MHLATAVAVSMLPVSRLKAAVIFNELRQSDPHVTLEAVVSRFGFDGPAEAVCLATARERTDAALSEAARLGIEPIPLGDPRYPPLLACVADPPPVLWGRGQIASLERPCVAIVGSRAATPYALQVAGRLAAELAERSIVVVSGLARGVDSAAHEGCLAAAGETIAVMGCGLDRVYPAEHRELASRIQHKGLLLSELAPGAPPLQEHFPLRNRIISGISLAVVVVEANEKSGSLITAACAAQQGRDVMAVPGSVLSGRNRGSHSLLKDGAKIVETADDVMDELGWPGAAGAAVASPRREAALKGDPLLSMMEVGEAYGLDDLARVTGTPAARLLPRLMELELLGFIDAPGAGRFVRSGSVR